MATEHPRHRLKAWREARGLSLVLAAKELECSPSMISAVERGERGPGRSLSARILYVVGIPIPDWDQTEGAPGARS